MCVAVCSLFLPQRIGHILISNAHPVFVSNVVGVCLVYLLIRERVGECFLDRFSLLGLIARRVCLLFFCANMCVCVRLLCLSLMLNGVHCRGMFCVNVGGGGEEVNGRGGGLLVGV